MKTLLAGLNVEMGIINLVCMAINASSMCHFWVARPSVWRALGLYFSCGIFLVCGVVAVLAFRLALKCYCMPKEKA